jgi:hypothetical protein
MQASGAAHTPSPGSDEAIALGCLCPVTDNRKGVGYVVRNGLVTYWQNAACPLHGIGSGYTVIHDYTSAGAWDA